MADKSKGKNSNIKAIVVAVLLVALLLFYFNYLSNKSTGKKTEQQMTELEALINYDMLGDYPKTPRDVVKLHCRFFKVFYGQNLSDDELKSLNSKIRSLYSSELLSYNSEGVMLTNLKDNIDKMQDEGYVYKSYVLPEASQVREYTQNGNEMATMEVTVTVNKGYMYIQYILIKENDQWKIHAWGNSKFGENN